MTGTTLKVGVLDDFRQLMRCYDPAGKFRNDLLDRYFVP